MNPLMDMVRFNHLPNPKQTAVREWVEAEGFGHLVSSVKAEGEGVVLVHAFVQPLVTLQSDSCEMEVEILSVHRRVQVHTPPPWIHPGWTDG